MIEELISQILSYTPQGQVAIVCERPFALISVLRKKWKQYERKLKVEQARTLNKQKTDDLTQKIKQITTLKFSASTSKNVDITFIELEEATTAKSSLFIFCDDIEVPQNITTAAKVLKIQK